MQNAVVRAELVRSQRDISVGVYPTVYHVKLDTCERYSFSDRVYGWYDVCKIVVSCIDLRLGQPVRVWTERGARFVLSHTRRDLLFTARAVYKLLITDVAKAIVRHIIRDWLAAHCIHYCV